jgi:hypothetical protein
MGQRESLNDYLKSVKDKSFEWGKHDCLTFTNNAFKAMYGEGWADDWLGRYMEGSRIFRRDELRKEFGFSTFTCAVDNKLSRINHIPPLGALVTTQKAQRWVIGVAMGICTGTKAVFLSKEGMLYLPLDYIHQAWVKEA